MRVYRCISAREVTNVYKRNDVRKTSLYGLNTYQYDKSKEYIHFFRYHEFADYYRKRSLKEANNMDRYVLVMTANIPHQILRENLGYGFYSNVDKRIKCHICPVPEYRIEATLFKREYIVEINDSVKSKYRNSKKEYDDYITLINELGENYHYDYSKVVNYLSEHDLDQLLGITGDDLTEEQIINKSFAQMIKKLEKNRNINKM